MTRGTQTQNPEKATADLKKLLPLLIYILGSYLEKKQWL
jgi:hypothetical protein